MLSYWGFWRFSRNTFLPEITSESVHTLALQNFRWILPSPTQAQPITITPGIPCFRDSGILEEKPVIEKVQVQ